MCKFCLKSFIKIYLNYFTKISAFYHSITCKSTQKTITCRTFRLEKSIKFSDLKKRKLLVT